MITYDKLATIIPPDQALANKALSVSLQQITGIKDVALPTFAATVSATQTMVNLPLVNAQTSAVAPSTAQFYANSIALGSSVNGTFVIYDFLGTAVGSPGTADLTEVLAQFSQMNLTTLELIYQQMGEAANGDLGPVDSGPIVISSGPAAGSYVGTEIPPVPPAVDPTYDPTALEEAIPALIAAANAEIVNLVAAYPAQTTELNNLWNAMNAAILKERQLQAKANLVWAELTSNNQTSLLALIESLPSKGQGIEVGGEAQFFEALATKSTLPGQAIIGILRQGPTDTAITRAGLYTSNNIPMDPDPPPPKADLGPTSYS